MNKNEGEEKEEIIGSGYILLVQFLLLLFSIPFLTLIGYLMLSSDIENDGRLFLSVLILVIALTWWYFLSYAQISIDDENVIIRKLWIKKIELISQVNSVDEAITPFTYILRFDKGSSAYFRLKPSDMIKKISDSDDLLESSRKKFKLNKL
jgi:hypothetical protein